MNIRIRKYAKRRRAPSPFVRDNPILFLGLELPFFVVASISLRSAVAMSIEMAIIHMVTMFFSLFLCRVLSGWSRAVAAVGVSTLAMVFARMVLLWIFPGITNSLGMYIYLMAVNGMTQIQASALSPRSKAWPVMGGAVRSVLCFSTVSLLISAVREYFGSGTLFGLALPAPLKLSALQIPFAGFLIAAFFFAGAKFFGRKLRAFSLMETMRREAHYTAIERPGER